MKKLFLLLAGMAAMLFCGCSGNETDDIPQLHPNPTESSSTLVRIILSENDLTFDATGGEQTVSVKFEYDDSHGNGTKTDRWQLTGDKSWCLPSCTSGGDNDSVIFKVEENTTSETRTATIKIYSGNLSETITITQQAPAIVLHIPQKGDLAKVLDESGLNPQNIISLKITGILNDVDFLTIRDMPNLKDLDISEVNITTLPPKAFYKSPNVENLILPNTLTEIGSDMFYESKLKSVVIPKSITIICSSAFSWSSLTSIEIPASVKTIEAAAFKGCSQLATVTFEKGSKLKTIGQYVFWPCKSLTSIEIPASVETIEGWAFSSCSQLATVTFEKDSKLKIIGEYAFSSCSSLTSIEIPASVETIEGGAFTGCSQLATVTFEKGSKLKTIKRYAHFTGHPQTIYYYGAFYDLDSLQIVDMSACTQVERIYECAFRFDSNLRLFKIGTATPPICCKDAFDFISPYAILKVPSGSVDAYKAADGWSEFASITELDE